MTDQTEPTTRTPTRVGSHTAAWRSLGQSAERATPAGPLPALPVPAVGDRYVSTDPGKPGRTVTVTRVWTAGDDGHTAVAYEWGDRGQCGSASPLGVFHGTYRAEAGPLPEPTVAPLTDAERAFLTWALDQAANEMQLGGGGDAEDHAAMVTLRKLAAGEQQ